MPTESDPRGPGAGAEAIVGLYLREAPRLPDAADLGMATAAFQPWPHQARVVRAAVERYPHSFLFCDEVGLGKTLEAGLALRQLWISGRVSRALLLVPKAVLRQWQEELHEKLCLAVPRFEGGRFLDAHDHEIEPATTDANPWNRHPLILASTQLARTQQHRRRLLEAEAWDLLIVDEAHHARRRRAADGMQPNRLLELLAGQPLLEKGPSADKGVGSGGLVGRSRCLYLLTATPMQVHAVEAWDLLRLLGLGGRWGGSERAFLGYFEELRRPAAERDWTLIGELLAEALDELPEELRPAPDADLRPLVEQVRDRADLDALSSLEPDRQQRLDAFLRCATPVHRWVWRHTRALLRRYRSEGLLDAPVPERRPENAWIALSEAERALYHQVEDYLGRFYQRYEARRTGLGFVMTVYRRRLTSSFQAIRRSLERRRQWLDGERASGVEGPGIEGLEVEDLDALGSGWEPSDPSLLRLDAGEQQSLFDNEARPSGTANLSKPTPVSTDERAYLDAFLDQLAALPTDSKLERLLVDLEGILAERDRVLVFTQYTDTLDHLREALVDRWQVACYSGRGGEVRRDDDWQRVPKEDLKAAFGRGEVQVLLCTEAASEGLNFQTCGVLINYDVPWNPMRVEQRIGRIDRIGQRHEEVRILNYFYADTVEAEVYARLSERIDGFREVIGELQPILHRVESTIQALAMTPAGQRPKATAVGMAALDQQLEERPPEVFGESAKHKPSLEPLPAIGPLRAPVSLPELETFLVGSEAVGPRFEADPERPGIYLLDGERAVTFDPQLYDAHPYTLELVTWGTPLFDGLVDALVASGEGELRRSVSEPAGLGLYRTWNPAPVSVFLAPADEPGAMAVQPVGSLDELRRRLEAPARPWTADEEGRASTLFSRQRQQVLRGMQEVEAGRRRAERRSIHAGAVDLLVRAAWVELVRAENPGLFDEPLPFGVGPESVAAQVRHGEPFEGLWRIATTAGSEAGDGPSELATRPEDPWPTTLRGRSPGHLDRAWNGLVERGEELLERHGAIERAEEAQRVAARDPSASGLLEREYWVLGELEEPPWSPKILAADEIKPFVDAVPYWQSLDAAVRHLLDAAEEGYDPDELARRRPQGYEWVALDGAAPGYFVAPVPGRALEPRWPENAPVLFRLDPHPPRNGRAAVFHHPDLTDPETGESTLFRLFTVETVKKGRHREQRLVLEATADGLPSIEVEEPEGLRILAVPVEVLGPVE